MLDSLKIEPTHKTPKVYFDPAEGSFEISGRSIPEDSVSFYKPLLDWLDTYSKSPAPKTPFKFELEYFNTSSSKNILELLKKLEAIHQASNSEVAIFWYYDEDDEDMEETGEDYKALLTVPLELVMKVF